jgi:hypothetical protein
MASYNWGFYSHKHSDWNFKLISWISRCLHDFEMTNAGIFWKRESWYDKIGANILSWLSGVLLIFVFIFHWPLLKQSRWKYRGLLLGISPPESQYIWSRWSKACCSELYDVISCYIVIISKLLVRKISSKDLNSSSSSFINDCHLSFVHRPWSCCDRIIVCGTAR